VLSTAARGITRTLGDQDPERITRLPLTEKTVNTAATAVGNDSR